MFFWPDHIAIGKTIFWEDRFAWLYLIAGVLHPGLAHPIPKTRRVQQDESKSVGKQLIGPQSTLLQNTPNIIVGYFLQGEDSSSSSPGKILHSSFWLQLSRARWRTKAHELYPQISEDILVISSQICVSVYPVGHWQGPHIPNCFGYFFPRAEIY